MIMNTIGTFLLSFFAERTLSKICDDIFKQTLTERLDNILKDVSEIIRYNHPNLPDMPSISSVEELLAEYRSITQNQIIKEFAERVIVELREDPVCYLFYLENMIILDKFDDTTSCLIKLDERNEFSQEKFFSIYPVLNIKVNDLYIEPRYKKIKVFNQELIEEKEYTGNFITTSFDIIEKYHLLFLFGPYGSGKTILSKKLLFEIKNGYSLFIDASKLPEHISSYEISNAIKSLITKYGKLYIFIDSCEDAFCNQEMQLARNIQTLLDKFDHLYFILNLRKPDGINYDEVYCSVNRIFPDIHIIQLCYFKTQQIRGWADNYCTISKEQGMNFSFTIDDIENTNKNLRTSCENPLILLMLALTPLKNNTIEQNWFALFDNFVKKTIYGKFELENRDNPFLINNRIEIKLYREFIEKTALKILESNDVILNIEQYEQNDFYLDSNYNSYSISQNDIISILSEIFRNNITPNVYIRYLNCYFFEYRNNNWKFKDNNILFFLCAAKFCKVLQRQISNYNNGQNLDKCVSNMLKSFSHIQLHPVMIEFILEWIKYKQIEKEIRDFIALLINEKFIINIEQFRSKKRMFKIDYDKINVDILFSIIFLHVNKSYETINYNFKRISQYYSFIKLIDKDLSSLILRYFRHIHVKNTEFRRINLKDYNWSYSVLNSVRFIQCKFSNTLFNHNDMQNTEFNLCYINDLEFNSLVGRDILYTTCEINNTIFVLDGASFCFKNCIINNVLIKSQGKRTITLSLQNCDIRQLRIIDCEKVIIKSSIIYTNSNIHLKKSNIRIYRDSVLDSESLASNIQKDNSSQIKITTDPYIQN